MPSAKWCSGYCAMEVEDASHASGWGIERDPNASNPIATIPTDRHAQCAEGDRSTQSATLLVPKAEEANSAAHSSSSLGPCCGVVAIIALLLVCAYCYTVAHQKTWSWQGEMLRENLLGTEVQNRVDHQARPRFLKFDNPPNDACMRQIFSHNGTSTKGNKWRELCSLRIFFVGGAHHSGTGLLRQLIVEFPLMKKHSGTNFPQDEGMFLQSVFPPVRSRDESFCGPCTPPGPTCVITCPALRRSYVTNENREILFHDWVERWGVLPSSGGSGLLVEKTPDFTMAFRTAMFPHVSVPVMIMRHPACSYAREEHIRDENDWGAVWADFLLEQMDNFVSRAALVRFEDIVTQGKDRVQENLWRVLGLTSSNKGEGEDRRLHLHSKVTSNTERLLWGEGHCPSFDEASLSAETRHLATLFGYGFEDSTHYLSRPSWLLPDGTNIVATKKDIIFIGDELRRFRQDQLARSSGEIVPTALLGGLLNDGLLPWNGDTIDGLRVENGMIAAYPNDPVPINRMLRELPSCDTVLRSSLSSVRCGAMGSHTWPVLVTGTPRSGTSSTQTALEHLGVKVSRDMFSPLSDGTVSWMLAFYDDTPFGHSRPKGGRFMAGIHQVWGNLFLLCDL